MSETLVDPDNIDYSDIEAKWVVVWNYRILPAIYSLSRYKVHYEDGFDKTLIVDGTPIIDKNKEDRLLIKITKEFTKKGVPIKPEDIHLPWDSESGKSKGYVA